MKKVLTYFLLGIFIGLKTGYLLGILFAPHKGSLTRMRLKNRVMESKGLIDERLDIITAQGNNLTSKLK